MEKAGSIRIWGSDVGYNFERVLLGRNYGVGFVLLVHVTIASVGLCDGHIAACVAQPSKLCLFFSDQVFEIDMAQMAQAGIAKPITGQSICK